MGTNCAPLLSDLFLHSYEADLIADLIRKKELRLAISFNLSFRYVHEVLSTPKELKKKDTTDTVTSASYLDLHLEIDGRGKLFTKL